MDRRLRLHERLMAIEGLHGNVYFQPPENFQMDFPCIVYEDDNDHWLYADNGGYIKKRRYTLKLIDGNPDSELRELVSQAVNAPMADHFKNDNLHHFVYKIYI